MKLSASQEGRLVRLARDGDLKARDRLADEFKGLVQGVARSHSHAPGDREELESAGAEALVAKLAKLADYDSNQGRLSTWLTPTIEGAIGKAAAHEARNRSVLESRRLDDEGEPQSEIERYAKPDTNFAALLDENDDDEELARPGADSARDPYLRTDRFPDIKEALLAFLRRDDPQAAIHDGTWDKMTHSPTLVSLLRQVRSDEARVASLAQEYRNLAPVLPSARAPRIFTQRDRRSDALARITHRAAAAGSLPERAQWAGLDVCEAESAVAHFRRWVLGGEPSKLWPDPVKRWLAAEQWVAEQAEREPAPDPEHILAYGDGKLRAIARGGALDTLKQCACQLVHDWGWSEEQAVRFILTGFAENVPKLRGAVRAGGLYGTHARIVMDIDPRTSPTEVASLYAKWRAALALMLGVRAYPDRDRPMKERTLALAVFVEENWQPGGSWRDLLASWNESHPAGRFPDGMQDPGANNFANHARQAWSRLSGTSWPTTTHAKSIHRDHGTGRPNAFSAGPDSP